MFFKKAETQIWMLIIFSVTIIIATWLLFLLFSYYKKHLENKTYISILWNIYTKSSNLHAINLCTWTNKQNISYNPKTNNYTLDCSWSQLWEGITKAKKYIKVISWCNPTDSKCIYKIQY